MAELQFTLNWSLRVYAVWRIFLSCGPITLKPVAMKDDGIREPSRNFEFLKFIHKHQRYVHLKSPIIKFKSDLAFFI